MGAWLLESLKNKKIYLFKSSKYKNKGGLMYQKITLSNIGKGALEEHFQYELKKVIENIEDENTPAKKIREINVKIKMIPTGEDRADLKYAFETSVKLPTVAAGEGFMMVGRKGEKIAIFEEQSIQDELFPEEQAKDTELTDDFQKIKTGGEV
jgi:hypothetical protein